MFRKILFQVGILLLAISIFGAERRREGTEWITAYWYNANDNKLPRILLIGDSICNGYQGLVNKELAGTAYTSFYATSKCVTDRSYLKELAYILDSYKYAVIHFNNGLHSLGTNPKDWEAGLRATLKLIRSKGNGAKIIWCSSTPLKNPALTEKVKVLNAIGAKVMRKNNIPVDDLFILCNPLDRNDNWSDTYHFKNNARMIQARQISNTIRKALGVKVASAEEADKCLKAASSKTGPDGKLALTSASSNNPIQVKNALKNADFETNGGWRLYPSKKEIVNFSVDTTTHYSGKRSGKIVATKPVQFYQNAPTLEGGRNYILKFYAKGKKLQPVNVFIRTRRPPYKYIGKKSIMLSTEWQEYSSNLSIPIAYKPTKNFIFFEFPKAGNYWLDNITINYNK